MERLYMCGACQHVYEDMETTQLSKDQLNALSIAEVHCENCGNYDLPCIMYECTKCSDPQMSDVYEMVFPLAKSGTGKDTILTIPYGEQIIFAEDFMLPDNKPLLAGENQNNAPVWHTAIAEIYKPLDFLSLFEVECSEAHQSSLNGLGGQKVGRR